MTPTFAYDICGNKEAETKPNGAACGYRYNAIDLLEETTFKETSSSAEATLAEYSYKTLQNGNTTMTATQHFSDTETADTKTTFDYAGRPIRVDQPDGAFTTSAYNANGTLASSTDANGNTAYYAYDGLNRQVRQWSPAGANTYEYSETAYDKAGRAIASLRAKNTVANGAIPNAGLVTTSHTYNAGGQLTQTLTSGGAKTAYAYDSNGNMTDKYMYYGASDYNREYYTYDTMDRLQTSNIVTQRRDIYGYEDTMASLTLTTSFEYDENGNLLAVDDPYNITTTYAYDLMDRRLSTSQPWIDANGTTVQITASTTYNWAGDALSVTDELGNVTSYAYDQRGSLSKVTDAEGGISFFAYDRAGRKTAEVSPKNYNSSLALANMPRTKYAYDQMGRVLEVEQVYKDGTGALKPVVSKAYEYDGNGNVLVSKDALGYAQGYGTAYEYDRQGRPVKTTDPENNITTAAYDGLGRVTGEANANGTTTAFTYDDDSNILTVNIGGVLTQTNTYDLLGNKLTSTDGNGNTSTTEYNSLNLPRTATLPWDATIGAYTASYRYTKLGQPASSADSLGKQNIITYDNQGRTVSVKGQTIAEAQAITVSSRYDKAGNLLCQTDGNGNTAQHMYDQLNRRHSTAVAVTDINNAVTVMDTEYGYDANGNLTSETDWRGNTYAYEYDTLNRLVQKTDPTGAVIEKLAYNDNNAQISSKDALNNTTQFQYDRNGRLTKTIDGAGNQQAQQYDGVGNVVRSIDGNNNSTYYTYDGFNRLTQVKNALNETTSYTYDNNGNMLTQADGLGNVTTVKYNVRDLPIRRIEPGGISGQTVDPAKAMGYTYKADGSADTMTDQNGTVTTYAYDIHGRVMSQSAGGAGISYTYDGNGNVLTQTDANGTTVRTYDELNRTTSKNVPGIGLTKYLYDVTANMPAGYVGETTTDPKGNATSKVYDRAGRLYQVKSGSDTATYTYFANGNRESMAYPNGVTAHYTYYADNRLNTLANKRGNTLLSTFNYAYDGAGNMLTKLELKGTTSYAYDALGRLGQVTEPCGKETQYAFDAAGNRLSETVTVDNSVTITEYDYNSQGRLTSAVETSGGDERATDFYYDNNGSQVSKLVSTISGPNGSAGFGLAQPGAGDGGDITFEVSAYDAFGRLVSMHNDNYVAQYKYNADGLRASKDVTSDGVTASTKFLYEGGYITLELDGSGNQTAYNVYGAGSIISRDTGQSRAYYLYNGRGDVVQLADQWGNVTVEYDYDAFGNLRVAYNNDTNPFRYCGEYFDLCSKRYYLRSRYYDPSTGRFTQRDAFLGFYTDPLSLNRYTYGHNNPIRYTDPSGLSVYAIDGNGNIVKIDTSAPVYAATKSGTVKIDTSSPISVASGYGVITYPDLNSMGIINEAQILTETSLKLLANLAARQQLEFFSSALSVAIPLIYNQSPKSTTQVASDLEKMLMSLSNTDRLYLRENLSYGSINDDVMLLQQKLNELGYRDSQGRQLNEDGEFGRNTLYAVNQYKNNAGLRNTGEFAGVVEQSTWEHLFTVGTPPPVPEPSLNPDMDTDLFIQTTVWNFFIDKGFTAEQVAGIMGNARQESTWNPLARGSGRSYWGLFQLNQTLAMQLDEKYREAGLDMSVYGYNAKTYQATGAHKNIPRSDLAKILEVQLEFVYNCKPTGSNWVSRLGTATSVGEATEVFLVLFEGAINSSANPRSGDKLLHYNVGKYYQEADSRRTYAMTYYNMFTR